jgi:hypothetical protein
MQIFSVNVALSLANLFPSYHWSDRLKVGGLLVISGSITLLPRYSFCILDPPPPPPPTTPLWPPLSLSPLSCRKFGPSLQISFGLSANLARTAAHLKLRAQLQSCSSRSSCSVVVFANSCSPPATVAPAY